MNEIEKRNFQEFYDKVKARFYREPIKQNGDEISAFDIVKAARDTFGEANKTLISRVPKDIIKMNLRNGYTPMTAKDKKLRRINSLQFVSGDDGYFFVVVIYENAEGKITDSERVDYTCKLGNCSKEVSNNMKYFIMYLDVLAEFSKNNQGMLYVFSQDGFVEPQYIGDDFISYRLNYNNVNNTAFLTDTEYYSKYDKNIGKDGNVCDFIDFYSDEYLKRTSVNMKDLDEFTQQLVKRYYRKQDMSLKR